MVIFMFVYKSSEACLAFRSLMGKSICVFLILAKGRSINLKHHNSRSYGIVNINMNKELNFFYTDILFVIGDVNDFNLILLIIVITSVPTCPVGCSIRYYLT